MMEQCEEQGAKEHRSMRMGCSPFEERLGDWPTCQCLHMLCGGVRGRTGACAGPASPPGTQGVGGQR